MHVLPAIVTEDCDFSTVVLSTSLRLVRRTVTGRASFN
jgi:hypothetical protein